jgi:hypothetical protein
LKHTEVVELDPKSEAGILGAGFTAKGTARKLFPFGSMTFSVSPIPQALEPNAGGVVQVLELSARRFEEGKKETLWLASKRT